MAIFWIRKYGLCRRKKSLAKKKVRCSTWHSFIKYFRASAKRGIERVDWVALFARAHWTAPMANVARQFQLDETGDFFVFYFIFQGRSTISTKNNIFYISIFDQKFDFFAKIVIFGTSYNFWLTKIFWPNLRFWPKLHFLAKFKFFINKKYFQRTRDFVQHFDFWSPKMYFDRNCDFDQNFEFWSTKKI